VGHQIALRYHCDKTTTDPAQHKGPFKHLKTFESEDRSMIAAEICEACGNTVIRGLTEDEKRRPEKTG
jgi:hypothetical protein